MPAGGHGHGRGAGGAGRCSLGVTDALHLKAGGKPDGCAVFARRPSVTVDQVERLVFSDDTGHIAQIARLRCPDGPLTVVNTHLRWDPPGTAKPRLKGLGQVRELLTATTDAQAALVVRGATWTAEPAAVPPIAADTPLPGPTEPSDHLAISARLTWR